MKKFFGLFLVVLAIAISVIPQFNNCYYAGKSLTLTSGKTVPMKCLWTARAELVTGISLLAVGVMMTVSRRQESLRSLSAMGAILSIFVMLLPTSLIGVCQTAMNCNTVMRPAMLGLGSLSVVGSLAGLVLAQKQKEKEI